MRTWLRSRPLWLLGLLSGAFYAVLAYTASYLTNPGQGPGPGTVAGAMFITGAVSGPWFMRQRQHQHEVTKGLTPVGRRMALKAAGRGAVPVDATVRAAATGLAETQPAQLTRWRLPFTVVSVVAIAAGSYLSLRVGLVGWLFVALLVFFLACFWLWLPRRAATRVDLLRGS